MKRGIAAVVIAWTLFAGIIYLSTTYPEQLAMAIVYAAGIFFASIASVAIYEEFKD